MVAPNKPPWQFWATAFVVIIAMTATILLGVAGFLGWISVTPITFIGGAFIQFAAAALFISVFWKYHARFSIVTQAIVMTTGTAVAWWGLTQPILTLLVTHLNQFQLATMTVAWMWELPGFGVFIVGVYTWAAARPLVYIKNPRLLYAYTLKYPTIIGVGFTALVTAGYIVGALQIQQFADLPNLEAVKLGLLGFISSIFIGVFFVFASDVLVRPIRKSLNRASKVTAFHRTAYARRIFIASAVMTFGVLLFVGMVVFESYQTAAASSIQTVLESHMPGMSSGMQGNQAGVSLEELLAIQASPNTQVIALTSPVDLPEGGFSSLTRDAVAAGRQAIFVEQQGTERVIGLFPLTQGGLGLVIVPVSDFSTDIYRGMQRYAVAAGLVLILSLIVTGYFSSALASTLHGLSSAVRQSKDSLKPFTFSTYTADELEELSLAFQYYINQSNELRAHLEEKVKQRTAALLRVEEEKRAIEVSAAQQTAQFEHQRRQLAEESAKSLEQKVQERTAALRDAIKRLQEIDRVKSEFISLASHQLRTPLTSLRWAESTLLEGAAGKLNEDQKEVVEAALDRTVYMMGLVNELLDVTRIEDQKYELKRRSTEMTKLLVGAVDTVREAAERKGVGLAAHVAEDLPVLNVDHDKITMAISNILDNAIKYTPKGGKVVLRATKTPSHIVVNVADSGIGIPKKDLYRTFSKFFRAENAMSMHTTGSGLGLYITKTIIEKHGGEVQVESEEKAGTTFTISIPTDQPREEQAIVQQEEKASTARIDKLGAIHTLVEDDEEET